MINKAVKDYNYSNIDLYYNTELSVAENLKVMQDNGIKVCRRTLYNYCKDRGICTSNVEQIISLLDVSLSVRKNLENVKANGIKVGDKKIQKLLKQLKDESVANEGNEVSETVETNGGSNCPQDKVESVSRTDDDTITNIDYRESIIPKECTNNYTSNQPSMPTQSDIIDEMEAYLMQLEEEINNTNDNEKDE